MIPFPQRFRILLLVEAFCCSEGGMRRWNGCGENRRWGITAGVAVICGVDLSLWGLCTDLITGLLNHKGKLIWCGRYSLHRKPVWLCVWKCSPLVKWDGVCLPEPATQSSGVLRGRLMVAASPFCLVWHFDSCQCVSVRCEPVRHWVLEFLSLLPPSNSLIEASSVRLLE